MFKKFNIQDTSIQNELSSKNSIDYFKELISLKNKYNVNSIKMGDEYIWPYVRNRLWIQLYGLGNGNFARKHIEPTSIQRGSVKDLTFKHRKQLKSKYDVKELYEFTDSELSADFLFFTVINAAEQVKLDNEKIYHRITDPFYEVAKRIGTAKKIEIMRVKTKSIEKSKKYYHKVIYIFPPFIYKSGYFNKIKFGTFLSNLKKYIPSLVHNGEEMRAHIDWELHTRDFYIELLKKAKPKVIFLNGYHYHAPLISAAHHLNIKSVDIQHGIQVGWNPLYNDWSEMPKEGYQALPDYFFVWSKKEFYSIQKVFKGLKHTPIIVGYPWLDRQLELTKSLDSSYIEKFSKYKIRVILALQRQPQVPKIYKDLISNSTNDILWIVRHHPKGNKFKIKDFSEEINNDIIINDYIDNISLPQLFKYTDIVISEGSTVAAEADYAGLYNFIFSKKGKGNYIKEINNGSFFFLNNYKDFYSIIKELDLSIREPRAKLYEKVNLDKVFKKLLNGDKFEK